MNDNKQLERGKIDCRIGDTDIVCYKWKHNKSVYAISNFHGSESITLERKQKEGGKIDVNCPVAVKNYSKYMEGVDKSDMFIASYGLSRKSKK